MASVSQALGTEMALAGHWQAWPPWPRVMKGCAFAPCGATGWVGFGTAGWLLCALLLFLCHPPPPQRASGLTPKGRGEGREEPADCNLLRPQTGGFWRALPPTASWEAGGGAGAGSGRASPGKARAALALHPLQWHCLHVGFRWEARPLQARAEQRTLLGPPGAALALQSTQETHWGLGLVNRCALWSRRLRVPSPDSACWAEVTGRRLLIFWGVQAPGSPGKGSPSSQGAQA